MKTNRTSQNLFGLLNHFLLLDDIKKLLRDFKDLYPREATKDVALSRKKEELLSTLEGLVKAGAIPIESIYDALREAEENGDQYVFYYKPTGNIKRIIKDGNAIAEHLFGDDWKDSMGFPKIEDIGEEPSWSDFRLGYGRKPQDWVAKMYAAHFTWKRTEQSEINFQKRMVTEERQVERLVFLARWNSPGWFEIRIPDCDSKTQLANRLNTVWNRFQNILPRSSFDPVDIPQICKMMLERRGGNQAKYTLSHVNIQDKSSGHTTIRPATHEEAIDDDEGRTVALNALMASDGSVCDRLRATWLPAASEGRLTKDLLTFIGTSLERCAILIPSRVSSEAVDYVTDQLRNC
jgi:hypothetical protein